MIIGLTGGIGSGKSVVAKIFSTIGVPVYNADTAAKELMNTSIEIKNVLLNLFGNNAYTEEGLNRKFIRELLFNNQILLEQMNNLVHPHVKNHFEQWYIEQKSKYVVKEAAILFESALGQFDKSITVFSPESIRISRVVSRDNVSEDNVKAIIKNQLPEEEKLKLADFIIYNNEEQLIIPQVLKIHEQLTMNLTI